MASKKGEVFSKGPPKSKARQASESLIKSDLAFIKKENVELYANLESHLQEGLVVKDQNGKFITIIPGSTVRIDCGIELDSAHDFDLVLRPVDDLAKQGVILSNAGSAVDGRAYVYLTNASKLSIAITHGQKVAALALIPFERFNLGSEN